VYYDYICPFCYLGTKRILGLSKEFNLTIDWKGIEIHPEFPPQGKKRTKTLKSKSFAETIREMAKEDNIEIKLPGFATNSRSILEASEFAKIKGKFLEFHIGVYEAYFLEGRNIGDIEIVLDIGEKAGLDKSELQECLSKRTMFDKIEANKKEAEDKLILGVPTFLFGDFPVHGNQSTQTMRHIIKRSLERSQN
ncbi:MAG: DsbA family protein, partial [Candidatus Dadabacteria bacterium]|nr:DsbA family protein [Candidatus Dadabacteria bacterium]